MVYYFDSFDWAQVKDRESPHYSLWQISTESNSKPVDREKQFKRQQKNTKKQVLEKELDSTAQRSVSELWTFQTVLYLKVFNLLFLWSHDVQFVNWIFLIEIRRSLISFVETPDLFRSYLLCWKPRIVFPWCTVPALVFQPRPASFPACPALLSAD